MIEVINSILWYFVFFLLGAVAYDILLGRS